MLPSVPSVLSSASIAVVRTDRLGDMVLTLPLCKALKEEFPESNLTLIARSYVAPLIDNCPFVDNVLFIDHFDHGISEIFGRNKFDAAFFPRPRFNEIFSAYISRIPIRIGSAYRLYSILFNKRIKDHRKHGLFHEAEYNVRMLSVLINKELKTVLVKPIINQASLDKCYSVLEEKKLTSKKFVILHPGSGGSTRVWPAEYFAKLAEFIISHTDYNVVVTGIASEAEICNAVAQMHGNIVNLCEKFDLSEMIALISQSSLLIANSTGVLHVAAALGVPSIGLFPDIPGLSSTRWGPYSDNSAVISPPEGKVNDRGNMNLIEPLTVFEAVAKLIGHQKS